MIVKFEYFLLTNFRAGDFATEGLATLFRREGKFSIFIFNQRIKKISSRDGSNVTNSLRTDKFSKYFFHKIFEKSGNLKNNYDKINEKIY